MLQSIRDFFFPRPMAFSGRKRARAAAAAAAAPVVPEQAPVAMTADTGK